MDHAAIWLTRMHTHGEAKVNLKSVMMTGAMACVMALAAPQVSHAQGATPSSGGGQSQVGNGNGVPSSPRTQGTTDRSGQTPQVPRGKTTDQPPTGSVGVDPRIPTGSDEQNREPNADTPRDQNGNDRSKTIDRNTGATANQVDPNDPNAQANQTDQNQQDPNQTPGTRNGTTGTGTVGTSGSTQGQPNGPTGTAGTNPSPGTNSGATGTSGSGSNATQGTTGSGANSGTNTPSGNSGATGSSGNTGTTPNSSGAGTSGATGSGAAGAGGATPGK